MALATPPARTSPAPTRPRPQATTAQKSGFMVRDSHDRVVLMFWGADAPHEAAMWAGRPGYSVEYVAIEAVASDV